MADASDFKLVMQLKLVKAHYKIIPNAKVGVFLGLESSQILGGSPFYYCNMADTNNFKFGMQLMFVKDHRKLTPCGKIVVALSW